MGAAPLCMDSAPSLRASMRALLLASLGALLGSSLRAVLGSPLRAVLGSSLRALLLARLGSALGSSLLASCTGLKTELHARGLNAIGCCGDWSGAAASSEVRPGCKCEALLRGLMRASAISDPRLDLSPPCSIRFTPGASPGAAGTSARGSVCTATAGTCASVRVCAAAAVAIGAVGINKVEEGSKWYEGWG